MTHENEYPGQEKTKFQFVSLSNILTHKYPPQNWVVDGLIPVEGMVAVSGDPGSYKTWLMMEMALSVASGKNFLGKFPTKQGGVIIVDEENPARLLQKRFKRMSLPEEELPISILPLSGFQLTDENVPFLLHEAKRQGTKLIIFDSLVRIHSADENDAKKNG
jgi:RecA-family ATPase